MSPTGLSICIAIGVLAASLSPRGVAAAPVPLAAWSFDEVPGESEPATVVPIVSQPPLRHGSGVYGRGLQLTGRHSLRVALGPLLRGATALTFSAWLRPESFDRYNEILRMECPQRVLFSFQENGTILSLGLNVGGYVECDATIDPAELLDGAWHYCASTFDGTVMRVYLDGRCIGETGRAGIPALRDDVQAFIGSSSGSGEFFQGGLDELTLYAAALDPEAIRAEYRRGIEAVAQRAVAAQSQLRHVYPDAVGFAATLAALRTRLAAATFSPEPEFGGLCNARLKADFPDEYASFSRYAERSPYAFAVSRDDASLQQNVRRWMALLTEYRPLTPGQWARLSPAQTAHWQEIDERVKSIETRLARGASNDQAWVEALLELGGRVVLRPSKHEAVAPYVTPATPPVRQRTPSEGRALLERDWLHQAGGNPTPERVRNETRWARELAERITANYPGRVDFSREIAALDATVKRLADVPSAAELQRLYFDVRAGKRAIMLANPAVDFSDVLLVDMPFPQGSEWRHETRHRLGYMAVPGGRLMVVSGLKPDGPVRQLMPRLPLHGSFWRPELSVDAARVLFCFKPHNEKSFHLYEIGLDGSGLRQLTDGPYDDLDPIYLPDGEHIMFSTTRGHTYVRCMPPTSAYVLARCDRNGGNIALVSRNNEPDYLPSVLDDGRVVYTRWEYTDKPLWRAQGLWSMRPDGTQVNTLWGNQSVWPDLLKDVRGVPNSRRLMFTGSAHHNWFAGSVGLIDPDAGVNFPDGLTKVTADLPWPESGNGPVDPVESSRYHASGRYTAYYSPYPLTEQDFLVSAECNGKFGLYLMDTDGNRELIYEGDHHVLHALPVRPRPRPAILADDVVWADGNTPGPPADGILYSRDVYDGAPPELRDRARYLRVLAIQPKTYTYWYKRPYLSTGPVVSAVQSDGVKEVLGTVPISPDGSVAFHAPSGRALHFQLLDEHYRALQTMRSFTGVMPGETRGCLGCHERHNRSPRAELPRVNMVASPRTISPPPWEDRTVSFPRYVRPVLGRYCAECHEGDGKGRKTLDLTERPGRLGFDEVYWVFTGNPSWGRPYRAPDKAVPGWGIAGMLMVEGYDQRDPAAYRTPPPMTALSYRSRLVAIAGSGTHHDVKVDAVNLRRLIVWVDAMCPYRGEEEIRAIPDPDFQGVDWLAVRPRIQTAPRIVRPGGGAE